MTAPEPTWHVEPDGAGEPTLWCGYIAVLERSELSPAGQYGDLLWQVLTRVLAPDEATIERLAREVTALIADDEDVVVTLTHREIRAVLAALSVAAAPEQDTEAAS